jgi:glyoxylase-like metal-dependent hydrolase (beta-lactamase superfamily II)
MSDKMLAAIRTISKAPDPLHREHVGRSRSRRRQPGARGVGGRPSTPSCSRARASTRTNAPTPAGQPARRHQPAPVALWPTDAFGAAKKTLFVTGEPIEILHQPAAHTDGDVMVFFRKSDVVAAGDVFVLDSYPVIDVKRGGTLQGVIDALNRLVDIAVPEYNAMGGTRIVPGHGRICNEIDVVEYRDMITIIRDRIAQLVAEGKTLAQVNAAGVTLEYDGVYGTSSGAWTTDMFIAAAYAELSATAARERSSRGPAAPSGRRAQAAAAATSAARPSAPVRKGPAESVRWHLGARRRRGPSTRRHRTAPIAARSRSRSTATRLPRAPRRGGGSRATTRRSLG